MSDTISFSNSKIFIDFIVFCDFPVYYLEFGY